MSANPEPEKEESYVLRYIEASISSSARARAVTVVMITAAVLVFTVVWNQGGIQETSVGWLDSRISIRNAALKFFYSKSEPNSSDPVEMELYQRAASFVTGAGLRAGSPDDKKIIEGEIDQLKRVRREQINLIRVPFFGVVFDSNDLGIFAGITFTVVLLWLRFSLARELRNLKLAFKEAEGKGEKQQRLCYELLAMHQILTLPPMQEQKRRNIWVGVALSLYLIPALVYLYEYLSDVQSREIGYILNPHNMRFSLVAGAVFLSLILILTSLCLSDYIRIDKEWVRASNASNIGNDVLDKPMHEQTESKKQRVVPESKRKYSVALLFASIFIASTTILLGSVSGIFHSTSDTSIWVAVFTAVVSAVGTISTIILAWRSDKRDAREKELKIAQLEQELTRENRK